MEEIYKKKWSYIFYFDKGKYFLDVVCGTIGTYTILIQLNNSEIENYKNQGLTYIDLLVEKIQENPNDFIERSGNVPN